MDTIFDNYDHAYQTILHVWTNGERGYPAGGFATCLIQAIMRADGDNLERIRTVYPEYVRAFEKIKGRG